MTYACLLLPFPPTTNNLFAGKTRRFPSRAYKEWKDQARVALIRQRPVPKFVGPVALTFSLGAPDRRNRDASNYVKAAEDLLVEQRIIEGDDQRYVKALTVQWSDDVFNAVRIEIWPWTQMRASEAA